MNYLQPNYLAHWGIKGQKWGIRRFQNPDGSLTAEGRKRYLKSDGSLTDAGEKAFKDRHGNLTNAGKAYEAHKERTRPLTPEERQARKEEAINSGDIKKIYAARSDMTNQELDTALNRIEKYKKINKLKNDEATREGRERMEQIKSMAEFANTVVSSLSTAYNTYEKLMKSMNKEDRSKYKKKIRELDIDFIKEHWGEFTTEEQGQISKAISNRKVFDSYKKPGGGS